MEKRAVISEDLTPESQDLVEGCCKKSSCEDKLEDLEKHPTKNFEEKVMEKFQGSYEDLKNRK